MEPVQVETRSGLVLRGARFRAAATDALPVILLHGGGQTHQAWRETAGALALSGHDAFAFDLRGHGTSDWAADGDYTLTAFARDVVDLVAASARPPVLVGASLGGIAALLALGAEGASSCAGLVLVDIAPRVEPAGAARVLAFMGAYPDGFSCVEEAAVAVAEYNPHRRRPPDLGNLERNLRQREDGRYVWHWDPSFLAQDRSDPSRFAGLEASARALRIPTLLVRGRESDLLSEHGVRDFLELVPHAEFRDVSGAGHMVVGDQNDAFSRAVLDFIETRCML